MRFPRMIFWTIIYTLGMGSVLLVFLGMDYFFSEGKGLIKETFERQETDSEGDLKTVRYLRLDDGREIKVSYPFWRVCKPGDRFEKEKYSFTFKVNDYSLNELWEFLPFLVVASIIFGVIFGVKTGWQGG